MSASSAITPTSSATGVIRRTSRLRMCDTSCASTPSSSRSSMRSTSPVVTATNACFRLRPAAKAFGADRRPGAAPASVPGRRRWRRSRATVEVGVVPFLDLLRAGDARHHPARGEPRDERVAEADDGDDGEDRGVEDECQQQPDARDEQREEQEQPERAPAVRANLLLERHLLPSATATGCSASSPASKNSRGSKRNVRAMMIVGNVCWRVLKRSTVAL